LHSAHAQWRVSAMCRSRSSNVGREKSHISHRVGASRLTRERRGGLVRLEDVGVGFRLAVVDYPWAIGVAGNVHCAFVLKVMDGKKKDEL